MPGKRTSGPPLAIERAHRYTIGGRSCETGYESEAMISLYAASGKAFSVWVLTFPS